MKKRFPHKDKVLLVNITRLGDMLQATPTVAGMKLENPKCKISVVVEKQFESVCRLIPHIDEVISIDLSMTVRALTREGEGIVDAYEYLSDFVNELRSRKFDYCLNMSSSAYTAMLLQLVGIKRNGGWTSDEEGYRVIESEWARLFATSVFHQNRQFNSLNLVDVFRCSADVERHPDHLVIDVPEKDMEYARQMLADAKFTNRGPIISIQAGASQGKRQWAPENFVKLINLLLNKLHARVVLIGSAKEMNIIQPIKDGCNSENVFVAAGKTDIAQLAGILKQSSLLITGDTGPMHIAAAVKTPVLSMFLASAFGYETGPYGKDNLVLQPIIGCGPCNPNKSCARPDCHFHLEAEAVAALTEMRLNGPVHSIPENLVDPRKVIVFNTCFDQYGFYHQTHLTPAKYDQLDPYRTAYRKLWLDDLGGYDVGTSGSGSLLRTAPDLGNDLTKVIDCANEGVRLIGELERLVKDIASPPLLLGKVNDELTELDRQIEQVGYHIPWLGPLTRMFVFAKENISGTEALELASQMAGVYSDLGRRCRKLGTYLNN